MRNNAFGMLASALQSMELPLPDSQFDDLLARIDAVTTAPDQPRFASTKPVRGAGCRNDARAMAEEFS